MVWPAVEFIKKKCKFPSAVTEMEMVNTMIQTFDCFLIGFKHKETDEIESPTKPKAENLLPKDIEDCIHNWMLFSAIWGLGGGIDEESRTKFCEFINSLKNGENIKEKYQLLDVPSS